MPLPAGRRPAWARAPRVWVPWPSRCPAGAGQRWGGQHAAPCWAEPRLGRGPTCVGALAITLPGWCGAAVGGAGCRSPPGQARVGPRPHVCGYPGHHAARVARGSEWEGIMPLPAGRSPARAGAHECGSHCHQAARLAPCSGGESLTQFPAGRSPAWARAPRVWVPRPSRCLAGAGQRWGGQCSGHDAAPRRAKAGLGCGPASAGALDAMHPG